MGIVIVTAYDQGLAPVAELTVPRLRTYAERHGYRFLVAPPETRGRHPYWMKYPAIDHALAMGAERVVWVDADVLVVRPEHPMDEILSGQADIELCFHGPPLAEVHDPEHRPHINNGVIAVRNSAWIRALLDRVWSNEAWLAHPWPDQAALLDALGYRAAIDAWGQDRPSAEVATHLGVLHPRWNSIPGVVVARDPVFHHFAGLRADIRLEAMHADIEMLGWRADLAPDDRAAAACFFSRFVRELKLGRVADERIRAVTAELGTLRSLQRVLSAPLRHLPRLLARLRGEPGSGGPSAGA